MNRSNLYRTLHRVEKREGPWIHSQGKKLLNFSSNDYLGLSTHQEMVEAVCHSAREWGVGASSSRLITGHLACHEEVEETFARFAQKEAALFFPTGYQANATLFQALDLSGVTLFLDRLCHNSLVFGAKSSSAKVIRFPHQDTASLEKKLAKVPGPKVIVIESLYSMDGTVSPLKSFAHLSEKYGAKLIVDDSHAFGVLGQRGRGLAADFPSLFAQITSMGKGGGGQGAFIATSKEFREKMVNHCPGMIYTTAAAPPLVAAAKCALKLIPEMEKERKSLLSLAQTFAKEMGSNGAAHLVPVHYGEAEKAILKEKELFDNGILAKAIRPPTVPPNSSRIRFSWTTHHTENHLKECLKCL